MLTKNLIRFCVLLLSISWSHQAADAKPFRAGAATVDITPTKFPVIIAGGFLEGRADKANDKLFVRCIVLDDGKTQIALTVVDTCMMTQELIDDAKLIASKECGIAVDHMMVSATHTHSAPAAMGCLGTRQDKEYAAWLPGKIAECIVAAHRRLQPARVGWASIDDWEHTHNRRWIRKPEKMVVDPFGNATGRAHMHPGYQSPDVIGPSGPVDPALSVISLQTSDGKPLAVLANYSQHYFGSSPVSADYFGLFCRHIAEFLNQPGEGNGPFVAALSQGTSGDLMWMDYGSPNKSISLANYAEAVARYAEKALAQVQYRDSAELAIVEKKLALQYRVPDDQRLEWAKPVAAKIVDDIPKTVTEVYAREALILHERQRTELKLQAIRIGDLTIATLPNEVYALTGLKLRGQSPADLHFNVELANGAEGYIPPPEQHVLGGYTTWPARTAGLEIQAEPKIVETLVKALEEVTQKPRKVMTDKHGPYAQAILDSKPIGYWRLNDSDGTIARNSVKGGQAAQLRDGFAWYLPGVGSGSGIGLGEKLVASPFSGESQINRAVHFAGGSMTTPVGDLGDVYSVVCWIWLGETSGASQRSGTVLTGPKGEKLIAHQFQNHQVRLELQHGESTALTEASWRADDWNFVVLSTDHDRLQVHVNGDSKPAVSMSIVSQQKNQNLDLVWCNEFQGKLDEVTVFNRLLKASEVSQLWKISGIAEQRAAELAARTRAVEEPLARLNPPKFPVNYASEIQKLKPTFVFPMDIEPTGWQRNGAVDFSPSAFASFRNGRLSSKVSNLPTDYGLAFWFRSELPNDARPVNAYLFSRGPDGDAQAPGDHLGIGGNYRADLTGKLIIFNGNASDQVSVGKSTIPTSTWNHVVMVRAGERVRLFLNGMPEPEIDASLTVTAPESREYYLGARSDHFAPLQGNMAFVSLFHRALTNQEAKQLHSASGQSVGIAKPTSQAPPKPASDPITPSDSLAKIHVPKGFRVDLVACEPQTMDPVAFDWDATGGLWVVEMADYPLGMDGKGKAGGRIRVLEDKDRDGKYETSRLFADGLNFPNGIMTWRDGVLVTAAPQLLYLRDTDGDGVADQNEVLFAGFNEGNQQLRMNHLRWGLDGWVYCANGGHHANHGLGTKVKSNRNGKTYEIGSRDFRFNPDSGDLELESGPSQYGRNRDAFGRWFGTQNANPLWHYVLPDRYLARNPYVATPSAIKHVVGPSSPKVYPASPLEKRFHSFEQSGRFTSACSGMIFGDSRLFGEQSKFIHAFTCEPFHNLVQHNLLTDDDVSFASERPGDEGEFDFFASEDRWCRPVMVRTGPDGSLWVADMYRYMIEHPDWLPPEGKAELLPHYRLGDDSGRIYRVAPNSLRQVDWQLDKADVKMLVAALDSPNDWQRDKAHQMLLWSNNLDAVPLLEQLIKSSPRAATRVQAMWVLEGLQNLSSNLVQFGLSDPDARVRENTIRIAERRTDADIVASACRLATDKDPKVCLQLALTLGQWNSAEAGQALAAVAARYPQSPLMVSAVMSSVLPHVDYFVESITKADANVLAAYREPLLRQSLGKSDSKSISKLLATIVAVPEDQRIVAVDEFLRTLQSLGSSLESLRTFQSQNAIGELLDRVEETLTVAQNLAVDRNLDEMKRFQAAKLLCRSSKHQPIGIKLLGQWLRPQSDPQMQMQTVHVLGQSGNSEVPTVLNAAWPELTPELRTATIDVWLSREPWARDLLNRIESKSVSALSLTLQQRNRLIRNPSGPIAQKAAVLFEQNGKSNRKEVVDRYRDALTLPGDVVRGKAVYMKACANCHRHGNDGHEVGPNLATVASHSPEKLLTNILDPNADIQPGYQSYSCMLETGEILVGLLAGETANSLNIKQANGVTRSIPRREIEKLLNSNISFMPEGVEATVNVQEMADLLKFLKN